MKFLDALIFAAALSFTGVANAQQPQIEAGATPSDKERVKQELLASGIGNVDNPNMLNSMGYAALYREKNTVKALRYFRWNIVLYPAFESQLYDSLGEALIMSGDRQLAIAAYERAIASPNAGNWPAETAHSVSILAKLRASEDISALQAELRKAQESK